MRTIVIDGMRIGMMDVEGFKIDIYKLCPLHLCYGKNKVVRGEHDNQETIPCPHLKEKEDDEMFF